MMAHKICCVPGCGKSRSDDVTLHMFPDPVNDADRFRTWLYTIGGDILNLDNQKIKNYRKVCHRHFEEKYHTRSKRLSAIAIPTLHVPGFCFAGQSRGNTEVPVTSAVMSGIEDSSFNDNVNVQTQEVQKQQPIICTESRKRKLLGDITNHQSTNPEPSTSAGMKDASNMKRDNVQINVKTVTQQTKTSLGLGSKHKQKQSLFHTTNTSFLRRKISRLQKANESYSNRLKRALNLSQNTSFQRALQKFSSFALIFTMLQFREINKKKMGRRFTKNEKIMALALYKQGPKAYRWLRRIFVLPSPLTLSRLLSTAALKAGINENIFKNLEKRVKRMKLTDKLCTLMFDEIAIAPHLDYNRRKDEIVGFVNLVTPKHNTYRES